MAAPVILMLITGDAVVECDLAGQSALSEQLEGAVDGGVADARILFLHEAVQFVSGEVVAGLEERAQDGVALRRLLQTDTLEMAVKDCLCFADHLAGDGRLVIDAFLQHERSG
jgi:hypothetical protein